MWRCSTLGVCMAMGCMVLLVTGCSTTERMLYWIIAPGYWLVVAPMTAWSAVLPDHARCVAAISLARSRSPSLGGCLFPCLHCVWLVGYESWVRVCRIRSWWCCVVLQRLSMCCPLSFSQAMRLPAASRLLYLA
jgi:hypothetical protein